MINTQAVLRNGKKNNYGDDVTSGKVSFSSKVIFEPVSRQKIVKKVLLVSVRIKTVEIFKQSRKDKIDHARLSDDESQKPSSRAGQGIHDLSNQSFVSYSLVRRSSFFIFFQGGCHWTIPNISFCLYDRMQNPPSQGSVEIANVTAATVLAVMSTLQWRESK